MENHVTATEHAEPKTGATGSAGDAGATGVTGTAGDPRGTAATGAATLPRTSSDGRLGNRIFAGLSTGSGILILGILSAVAAFLLYRAWPALTAGAGAFSEVDFMSGRGLWTWGAPPVVGADLSPGAAPGVAVPVGPGSGR